jgi:hypothetical protein
VRKLLVGALLRTGFYHGRTAAAGPGTRVDQFDEAAAAEAVEEMGEGWEKR